MHKPDNAHKSNKCGIFKQKKKIAKEILEILSFESFTLSLMKYLL